MPSKLKNLIRNIILSLFTILLTFFCADIVIHLVLEKPHLPQKREGGWAIVPERVWTTYDETLGWHHLKNKKAVLVIKDRQIPISTNSSGFRGPKEYGENKDAFEILSEINSLSKQIDEFRQKADEYHKNFEK